VRVGSRVRQETVATLGDLDAAGRARARALAREVCGERLGQVGLFESPDESAEPVAVRLNKVRLERQFGDVWLGWTLWRALRLDTMFEVLAPQGREEVPWSVMAAVLV
jgi:broad specificity phosphatase PhoE